MNTKKKGKVELKTLERKKDNIPWDIREKIHKIRGDKPGSGILATKKYLKERSIKISHNKIHEIKRKRNGNGRFE